jgi:hypothetical protein
VLPTNADGLRLRVNTEERERRELRCDVELPLGADAERALACVEEELGCGAGRVRRAVVDVRGPLRVPARREVHKERVRALGRLRRRVRRAVVQENGRAVAYVHVDVPERRGERCVATGRVDDVVRPPVAPDGPRATRECGGHGADVRLEHGRDEHVTPYQPLRVQREERWLVRELEEECADGWRPAARGVGKKRVLCTSQ